VADWSLLAQRLRTSTEGSVHFTWSELDALVGGMPATASNTRPWWSGNRSHVRQWRSAGFTISNLNMGREVTFIRVGEGQEAVGIAGDSLVQRSIELVMLELLSARLGVELSPQRLTSPSGAYIDVDGVASDRSVLVECWAHQGPAKVAQKYKLVNDATKLHWASSWLVNKPERLLLCVSDEMAIKHLRGTSWQGRAIADMGVELAVVELEPEAVASILEAQKRQFR